MTKGAELLTNSLRCVMEKRGWNQKDLAAALKMEQPNLSRLLSEKARDPQMQMVLEIAHALEMEPWELLRPKGAYERRTTPEEAIQIIADALSLQAPATGPRRLLREDESSK